MAQENIKNAVTGIFTKSRMKKAGVLIVIAAVAAGGFSYYRHEQKIAQHTAAAAARTAMIEAQAQRENVALLSEDEVQRVAAEAIGKDAASITFRRIALTDAADRDQHEKDGRKKEHREGKHGKHKDRGEVTTEDYFHLAESQRMQHAPAAPQNAPAPAAAPGASADAAQAPAGAPVPPAENADAAASAAPGMPGRIAPAFLPVYKVTCIADNVKYKLRIDAVSGNVLSREVEG